MELASSKSRSKSLDFDCDDSNFLFKNRKFVSIDRELSVFRGQSTASSSLYSGDSDWGSFSEDDEIEVRTEQRRVVHHLLIILLFYSLMSRVVKFIISQRSC